MDEHLAGDEVEVRRVQPYQARKAYLCPGCNQDITEGLGHLVVVPGPLRSSAGTGTTLAGLTGGTAAPDRADNAEMAPGLRVRPEGPTVCGQVL